MKLKRLFKDIKLAQIKGTKDPEIKGISSNSKSVAPGYLFIARKGFSEDGSYYIPDAIAAGAVAILTDIYDPLLDKNILQVIHPQVAKIEGQLASEFYGNPSNDLYLVGITGTNGKTTTSYIIKHLLDGAGSLTGLIGTIEYIVGNHRYQATRTTPDVESNQKMLREMTLEGCKSAVMEVTSHALDQNRVDCIDFDAAIFTNLTIDHLDYHKTLENYFQAKQKLFSNLNVQSKKNGHSLPKISIINGDSPYVDKLRAVCKTDILTYGIDQPADIKAEKVSLTPGGTTVSIDVRGQKAILKIPLVGRFNVYNCLAATALGIARKMPLEQILSILSTVTPVPGRLEAVPNPLGLKIYVDFAHSDDALKNVLETLTEFKTGKIILVFGCGGNRDASKRPLMAKAAESLADISIVTSDNPRSEDPEEIIRQIVAGFSPSNNHQYLVEVDRHKAIEKAITLATSNDIILIAGKGHESYQVFAHHTIEFDDRQVSASLCKAKTISVKY